MEYLALICSVSLLIAMLFCLELGRRYGLAQVDEASDPTSAGKRIVEGGFFALMSLLIAFSFSGAVSRFDDRRALIVEEANNIGTAYLRIHLLPPDVQPKMRDLFRGYLDERLAVYHAIPDMEAVHHHLGRSIDLQEQIWVQGVAATRETGAHPNAGVLLINSLNSMIDIANERTWAALTHPPASFTLCCFWSP